jgi:hypothetical protein
MKDSIAEAFEESIRVKRAFLKDNLEVLTQAIDSVVSPLRAATSSCFSVTAAVPQMPNISLPSSPTAF